MEWCIPLVVFLAYINNGLSAGYQNYVSTHVSRCWKTKEELQKPYAIKGVHFYLWTKPNPSNREELFIGNSTYLKASSFNTSWPTKIAIHGFASSSSSAFTTSMREEYFRSQQVNFMAVDWSQAQLPLDYNMASANTRPVGEMLSRMICFLVQNGASLPKFHILGYSLGAHVAGHAGRFLQQNRRIILPHITGLDPAGPNFEHISNVDRLDATDAMFVDVIHTNAGEAWQGAFGMMEPVGHVDFYPNCGSFQPGCSLTRVMVGGISLAGDDCSHGRSWEYFAESINTRIGFFAVPCGKTYQSLRACSGRPTELMGEYVSRKARGVFFLRTNTKAPYALGRMPV